MTFIFTSTTENSTGNCFCLVQSSAAHYWIIFSRGSRRNGKYLRKDFPTVQLQNLFFSLYHSAVSIFLTTCSKYYFKICRIQFSELLPSIGSSQRPCSLSKIETNLTAEYAWHFGDLFSWCRLGSRPRCQLQISRQSGFLVIKKLLD